MSVCEIFQNWFEEFTENLEDTEAPAPAQISRDSDSERPTKVARRKHSVENPLSKRPQLRRMLWEPKEKKPLAEDAVTKLYHEQKNLVTWSRRITKFSVKNVNHGTITETLSWFKILLLNGSSLIRVKRRLHMRRKREVCENSWSRHTNEKLLKTDNSTEFGKACEDLSWNHRTSTPHRSETNGIAERAVRQVKEGTSAVFLQSGLDERWWSDSMECYCYPRNVQDLLADGKTPCERQYGEKFTGPIIPFGSMVAYHPISMRDQSWFHQFEDCGKDVFWLRLWKNRIRCTHQIFILEGSTRKKVLITQKKGNEFIFSPADGTAKLSASDYEFREPNLRREPNRKERRFQQRTSRWTRRVSTDRIQQMTLTPEVILVDSRWLHLSSSQWTSSSTRVPKEETFPIPLKYIEITRSYLHKCVCYKRRRIDDYGKGFTKFALLT